MMVRDIIIQTGIFIREYILGIITEEMTRNREWIQDLLMEIQRYPSTFQMNYNSWQLLEGSKGEMNVLFETLDEFSDFVNITRPIY